MTKVHVAQLQKCIDYIQSNVVGVNEDTCIVLYKFYKTYIDMGGSPTLYERKKYKVHSKWDRSRDHMISILKKYDISHIFNCIDILVERINSGKTIGKIVRPGYFDKILENKN